MSEANPLWGAPRIHGELLKLGVAISQASVARSWFAIDSHRARTSSASRPERSRRSRLLLNELRASAAFRLAADEQASDFRYLFSALQPIHNGMDIALPSARHSRYSSTECRDAAEHCTSVKVWLRRFPGARAALARSWKAPCMTIRLTNTTDADQLPDEAILWRLARDGRAIECRMRIVPLGDGVPEIRFLITRADGTFDLLWSAVMIDGCDVNEFAQMKLREFEVRGWIVVPPGPDDTPRPS
jgi:hypothetical protein